MRIANTFERRMLYEETHRRAPYSRVCNSYTERTGSNTDPFGVTYNSHWYNDPGGNNQISH